MHDFKRIDPPDWVATYKYGDIDKLSHPAAKMFPLLRDMADQADSVEKEPWALASLYADIKEHGLVQKIVLCDGKILDGRNRLAAFSMPGFDLDRNKLEFLEYAGDDPVGFVISANIKRRHLTQAAREKLIDDLRQKGWSTRKIAAETGTSQSTVARAVRRESSDSQQPATVTDSIGRKQPARKTAKARSKPAEGWTPEEWAEQYPEDRRAILAAEKLGDAPVVDAEIVEDKSPNRLDPRGTVAAALDVLEQAAMEGPGWLANARDFNPDEVEPAIEFLWTTVQASLLAVDGGLQMLWRTFEKTPLTEGQAYQMDETLAEVEKRIVKWRDEVQNAIDTLQDSEATE